MRLTGSSLKRWLSFAALLAIGTLQTGCTVECYDRYDCRQFQKENAGKRYTCESNSCVPCPDDVCPGEGSGGGDGSTGGGDGSVGGGTGGSAGGGTGGSAGGGTGGSAGGGTGGSTGGGTGGSAGGGTGGSAGGGTGGSAGGGMADSGTDAGLDAGQDAGTDAGVDAGPADYSGTYTARLNGAQELPPSGSAAEGTATVTLTRNASDYSVSVNGTHSVTGNNLSAHLHTAIGGLSGNVEVSLAVTAQILMVPGTVGTLTPQTITNQVAQEIGLGRAYVNIHSQGFSGGEIRGQVLPAGAGLMTALLSGADQVPSNGYPAGVSALQLVLRPDAGLGLYTGLWPADVDAVAAHIHQGGTGASTPSPFVNFTITPDGHGAAGSIDIGPGSAFVTGNTDGGLYVNVHTSDAGSGLIRGQLIQVLAPN